MALTRDSVLHYWSARYGPVPIIGGKPVHSRSSAAKWVDGQGIVQDAIVNTPRFEYATISGERRPVMRLQKAATNSVATDLSGWATSSVTVTSGKPNPQGGTGAYNLDATSNGGLAELVVSSPDSISICLRYVGGASNTWIGVFDVTAATWRYRANVAWSAAGVPTVTDSLGSGIVYPVRALVGGWYEVAVDPAGVLSANTNKFYLYPAAGSTGSIEAFLPVAEGSNTPSGLIPLGSTRAADQFYWNYTPVVQNKMVYVRLLQRNAMGDTGARIFQFGAASDNNPRFLVYDNAGLYRALHAVGASTSISDMNVAPSVGSVVELVAKFHSDGVTLIQSINAAAVATAGGGSPVGLAPFSDSRLFLNSVGTSGVNLHDYAEVKVVKYADVAAVTAQGIMDELRAFELSASGEVIS